MAGEDAYVPLFTTLPASLDERWERLKRFLAAWGSPVGPPEPIDETRFEAISKRLGHPIPEAVRAYYEQGFFDLFRSRSLEPEHWIPLETLKVDPISGGVRFVDPASKYLSGRAWPLDTMDRPDPPVMDDIPADSLEHLPPGLHPTGLTFSAWLIREALGLAQHLAEHRRSLESDAYRRTARRLRRTFTRADVDGRQGDQTFTFFEADDAVYFEIAYEVGGQPRLYNLIVARTADALDRYLRRGIYAMTDSPLQAEFERLFREHLAGHERRVVEALGPVIEEATALPEEADAIVFRIFPYWDVIPLAYTAYEQDGSEVMSDPVFGGELLPESPPLIPEGAIDRDRFENEEVDTQHVGDRILAEWFADCWERAGGGRVSTTAYIHHDGPGVFDLARKQWVELDADWL